jgi:hypothetical protein
MAKDYPNSGILFVNDRKKESKHPDYQGELDVDGVKYWLSGWKKQGAKGTFLSLSVKPKEDRPRQSQGLQQPRNEDERDYDPFS